MSLLDDLNSLTEKHLGVTIDSLGSPEAPLEPASSAPRYRPGLTREEQKSYRLELATMIRSSYGKQKVLLEKVAWRCLNCNKINGLQANTLVTRKTCKKCAKPRSNPFSLYDELLMDILINSGYSESEALEKIKETNSNESESQSNAEEH